MKINERVFERLNGEAFEIQELEMEVSKEDEAVNKRKVELFYLDEYPEILDEFSRQGKFAVWSSVDGVNYRLAIETGYYETLKELYGTKVNKIWTDFWDECSKISSNFTRKIVLPGTIIVVLALIIFYATLRNSNPTLNNGLSIAVGVIYLFVVLVFRKLTTKKISDANREALEKIKKYLGNDRFEELLDAQRKYIDDYTQRLIEEADRMDAEFEASQQALANKALEDETQDLNQSQSDEKINDEVEAKESEDVEIIDAEIVEEERKETK